MEALTVSGLRERYPEFTEALYPDAKVRYALELATEVHSVSHNASYALAAHILYLETLEKSGGATVVGGIAGVVKKRVVGRVSTEFVTMSKTNQAAYYETTRYGKLYLTLKPRRFSTRVC